MGKNYQRLDEDVLMRIMDDNKYLLAEILILLAWKLGLTREEIYNLKWDDISFEEKQIQLPDRIIPMDEDSYQRLVRRWKGRGQRSEYVAASDRGGERIHKQYIPRCVRKALDDGGAHEIDMVDMRHDYVIRQLEAHDWPYVVKVTGMTSSTLFTNYAPYAKSIRGKREKRTPEPATWREQVRNIIKKEGTSPVSLALALSLEMGLSLKALVALTWDQVNLEEGYLYNEGQKVSIPSSVKELLLNAYTERAPDEDPHVILNPQSRRPVDYARVSGQVKVALSRVGMEDVTIRELSQLNQQEKIEDDILRLIYETGPITRNDVLEQLQIPLAHKAQAYSLLRRMVWKNKLVLAGQKYYIPGTVLADPEEQYNAIRAYLEENGGAYRQDLADILKFDGRKCGRILQKMIEEGKLKRDGQRYCLPEGE